MKILVSYIGKGEHLTFKNMPTNLMLEEYFRNQKNRKNVIVTGGCIASGLRAEKINDFDVYFKTKEAVLAVAEHYANKMRAAGKEMFVVDGQVVGPLS